MARWDESELTISRPIMVEVMGKVDFLGEWNDKSADFINDLCEVIRCLMVIGDSGKKGWDNADWMLYFEATKWAKTLKGDTSLMIEGINELIYPEGRGR